MAEPGCEECPLSLVRDIAPEAGKWDMELEDLERRSFMAYRPEAMGSSKENKRDFKRLYNDVNWVTLKNWHGEPSRHTAWYVAEGCGCVYTYGKERIEAQPMPDFLTDITRRAMEACGVPLDSMPNSCNIN